SGYPPVAAAPPTAAPAVGASPVAPAAPSAGAGAVAVVPAAAGSAGAAPVVPEACCWARCSGVSGTDEVVWGSVAVAAGPVVVAAVPGSAGASSPSVVGTVGRVAVEASACEGTSATDEPPTRLPCLPR